MRMNQYSEMDSDAFSLGCTDKKWAISWVFFFFFFFMKALIFHM